MSEYIIDSLSLTISVSCGGGGEEHRYNGILV